MLTITIPPSELFDEARSEFLTTPGATIVAEHSLLALSKWESKFKRPLLASPEFSLEDLKSYFECMCFTPDVPSEVFQNANSATLSRVSEYLMDPHTATTVPRSKGSTLDRETVTSELIYYWMVALNIPFETETWNLNRLITLIEVCNHKSQKPKKTSRAELYSRNRELNRQRRAKYSTKG